MGKLNTDWLNKNKLRDYPLKENVTPTIPQNVLVDMVLSGTKTNTGGINPENVDYFIKEIICLLSGNDGKPTRRYLYKDRPFYRDINPLIFQRAPDGNGYFFLIREIHRNSYNENDKTTYRDVAYFFIPLSFTPYSVFPVVPIGTSGITGKVIAHSPPNPMWSKGIYSFNISETEIESSCLVPTPSNTGVNSLAVDYWNKTYSGIGEKPCDNILFRVDTIKPNNFAVDKDSINIPFIIHGCNLTNSTVKIGDQDIVNLSYSSDGRRIIGSFDRLEFGDLIVEITGPGGEKKKTFISIYPLMKGHVSLTEGNNVVISTQEEKNGIKFDFIPVTIDCEDDECLSICGDPAELMTINSKHPDPFTNVIISCKGPLQATLVPSRPAIKIDYHGMITVDDEGNFGLDCKTNTAYQNLKTDIGNKLNLLEGYLNGSIPIPGGYIYATFTWNLSGPLSVISSFDSDRIASHDGTVLSITGIRSVAGTSGTSVVDVNLNGVSILTSLISFSGGNNEVIEASFDPVSFSSGGRFDVDLDSVEDGSPRDITIKMEIRYSP